MSNYEHRDNNDRNNFREDGSKTQLFIAKGKNDGMDPQSLVEFVAEETNVDQAEISNVKVLDAFSFFAVPNDLAGEILDYFQAKAGEEGRPLVSKAKRKQPNSGGFGDRPRRDFGDRPRRDFGNSERSYNNDRPRRDYGNRND